MRACQSPAAACAARYDLRPPSHHRGSGIVIVGCVRRPMVNRPASSWASRDPKRARCASPRAARNTTNHLFGWNEGSAPTAAVPLEFALWRDTALWSALLITPNIGPQPNVTRVLKVRYHGTLSKITFRNGEPKMIRTLSVQGNRLIQAGPNDEIGGV